MYYNFNRNRIDEDWRDDELSSEGSGIRGDRYFHSEQKRELYRPSMTMIKRADMCKTREDFQIRMSRVIKREVYDREERRDVWTLSELVNDIYKNNNPKNFYTKDLIRRKAKEYIESVYDLLYYYDGEGSTNESYRGRRRIDEAFDDSYFSGIMDYQGTGSKESEERMEKIRKKRIDRSVEYSHPGSLWTPKQNDSMYDRALKLYGKGCKSAFDSRTKICDPIKAYAEEIKKYNDPNLNELARDLEYVWSRWYMRHNRDRDVNYKI